MKRISGLGAVLVVIMLGAAACGGGGVNASGGTNRAKKNVHAAASVPSSATVMVAESPLGKILVDANGHTLYEFDHDTPTTSACTGACTSLWPALIVSGTPHAGTGIDAAKLAVLAVTAGSQVTYAGHPLHTFANDHAPGDLAGQGLGGLWWVIGADGHKIATPTATAATPAPTAPPQTAAPDTAPPATSRPAPQPTNPPMTQRPPTTSPGTGGTAF